MYWSRYLQVSRTGTSNYIPQYMWDVSTCPCLWFLFLAQHSSHMVTSVPTSSDPCILTWLQWRSIVTRDRATCILAYDQLGGCEGANEGQGTFIVILAAQRSCWGVYWFHSVCPSVHLSVPPSLIPCPLCSAYNSGWIHFILIHLIKQLQKVCRV